MNSYMKRISTLAVALAALLLVACSNSSKPNDNTAEPVVGTITVVSGGKTYAPLANWIYSLDANRLAADGARKQPEEVVDELEAIPYEDDLQIVIDGEQQGRPSYTLYNGELEQVYYRESVLTVPQEKGEYILFVELSWGNEEIYTGYQYFFKLAVASSQSELTPPPSSNHDIRGINETTELIGTPDRIIMMRNEAATVFDVTSPEYESIIESLNGRMPDGFAEAASGFVWLKEDLTEIDWSFMAQDFDYLRLCYDNTQTVKINCIERGL